MREAKARFSFQTGSIRSQSELPVTTEILSFHSKLVRLEVQVHEQTRTSLHTFSFQTGSIRSLEAKRLITKRGKCFHSKLVRLEEVKREDHKTGVIYSFHSKLVRLEDGDEREMD